MNFLKWFLLWAVIPPLWAILIRKKGMKKRWIIPLMLLSPVSVYIWGIILIIVLFFLLSFLHTEDFSKIKTLETREDICVLTEMTDFPEFTFEGRSDDPWNYQTWYYFTFKDSLTETQQKRFTERCRDFNNARWEQTDTASWRCVSNNVEMTVRKDGFTINESHMGMGVDSLTIPGLSLPPHEMVSKTHWIVGPDYTNNFVIKLHQSPRRSFYKNWTYDPKKQEYSFETRDEHNNEWFLRTRKGSKVIRITYTDF